MTDAPPTADAPRPSLHVTQEQMTAYAATCATVIVHTETITLVFAARVEHVERAGVKVRRIVIDEPDSHDYEMIRGMHEQKISAREQAERARLASEVVASLALDMKPTTPPVPRPWAAYETTETAPQSNGGNDG